jgi:hypothetical protein
MVAPVPAQISKFDSRPPVAARPSDANTRTKQLPPSSESRGANISPVLSSFRILPVATGVYPLSCPTTDLQTFRHANSFVCIGLPPLCRLLPAPVLCFQSLGASFPKTPGWGWVPISGRGVNHIESRLPWAVLFPEAPFISVRSVPLWLILFVPGISPQPAWWKQVRGYQCV